MPTPAMPQPWPSQRWSCASAAISAAVPMTPSAFAYAARKPRMLGGPPGGCVDGGAQCARQAHGRIRTVRGCAHDRAPDDDAIGNRRHGARLLGARDAEADAD